MSGMKKILSTVDDTTLDEDDWNDVVMECSSLASHWEELCAYLGLRMGTIEVIKAKHHDKDQACWNSSLHNWILQKYNTEKYGYPSWRTLLKAVGRVDGALFNKLAEEHQLEGASLASMVTGQVLVTPSITDSGFETPTVTSGTSLESQWSKEVTVEAQLSLSVPDSGFETASVASGGSLTSQLSKEISIETKVPDSVLDHIRMKYHTLSTTHKNQCPYHLQNVAELELLEMQADIQNSSKKQVENSNIGKWVTLSYHNLFKGVHGTRKVSSKILIVGEGGIGKTILCSSIAEDWANGKLFQEFLMVLLLPLDQRKVASAQNFVELLNILYEFDSNTCATVERYLTSNTEENILIIADEWDELCETEYQEGSFMHHLLFGTFLPSSSVTVVIMSRPESISQHTQQSTDRFIRVQGFSKETTDSSIQLEFGSNPEKFSCIKRQLENNPLVENMCCMPLNLALICNLHQTCRGLLPSTMTELYSVLAINLIQMNLNSTRGSTLHLSTYRDLPKELQQPWLLLCELAFRNMETSHAALSTIEATRFLSSVLDIFGLLKLVSSRGDKVTFSFINLNFEQYLAALYLIRQPLDMQMEVIRGMSTHIGTVFWRFYFGMSQHIETIMRAVSMLSTLHRTHNDEYLLCHYSFESQSQIVQREVVKTLTASGSALLHCHSAYDCMAIVYVIQNMEEECTVEIKFQNCDLKAKQICQLASALDAKSHVIQVKGLDLSDNGLNDSIIVDFFNGAAAALKSLEKLFLRSCGIGREGLSAILDALARSSCKSLAQFDLSFNTLTTSCLELLQYHINCGNLVNIEILILKGSFAEDISMMFMNSFAATLSSNCQCLRRLDLSANRLGTLDDPDLTSVISQFTSLGNKFDLRLDDDYMSEVDGSFLTVMEESIRNKGTIDHTIAHGVIVGPGRSGKNTLMKRLMGEGPPTPDSISPSTGVLENVVKVEVKKFCTVAASVKNLKWQRMEYDEEALELMMMTTRQYKFVSKPLRVKYIVRKLGSRQDVKSVKPSDKDHKSKPATIKSEEVKPAPAESNANDHPAMDGTEETNRHVVVYSTDLAPVDIFKKAVKLRRMDALREHLESSWSLYLTNTGGQIEFQEHLPLLVCGPSIFFVTFPLHHDLERPYDVQYQYPDGSVKKYSSTPTLMQELLQTLATIYALDYASIEYGDTELSLKPKVFFIGTHRDCLLGSESEKAIKEIDNKLQRFVRQTSLFHQGSIQFASERQSGRQLIFTVNNLSKDDKDFQMIRSAVQQTVEKKCYKEFTVQCPSSWLIFSLILRAKHKSSRVLRVDDCLKIAQECGISDHRELTSALSFIHSRLGLVRYFNVEGLNSLVVIDPQVLFDKITDLIVQTFISENAEQNEIEEFHEKGIISVAVMKNISDRSNSDVQLPFMWITKLLNHLKIAALFRDRDGEKYFFPSVLCHVPEPQNSRSDSASVLESQVNQPPPVLVAFETGFCPRGISGALIKCLMTNEMKSNRRWELLPDKVYRNQVSFYIERCVDVTLKLLPTHLEITVDSTEEDDTETEVTCREAYTQISKCMRIVTSLYRKCEYYWTFYCTLTECQTHPHPAAIEWDRNRPYKLRCKVSNKRFRPPKGYELWNIQKKHRPGEVHLGVEVQPKHLGQIADLMAEWEGRLVDEFNLTESDVAAIKTKYPGELRLQSRAVLQTWKQRSGSKGTYKKLIKIFEHAGYKRYADDVRMIAHDSDSGTDHSSGSGEEHSPVEQPPTYPPSKPQKIPQPSSVNPEATEMYVVVSEADAEVLQGGGNADICSPKMLESRNVSFVPKLSPSMLDGKDEHHSVTTQPAGTPVDARAEEPSGDDSTSKTTGQRTEDTDGKSNVLPAIKVSSLTEQSSGNQSIHKDTMSSVNDDSPAIPSNKGQYPSLEVNTVNPPPRTRSLQDPPRKPLSLQGKLRSLQLGPPRKPRSLQGLPRRPKPPTFFLSSSEPENRADPGVDSRIAQVKAQVKAQMGVLVLEGKTYQLTREDINIMKRIGGGYNGEVFKIQHIPTKVVMAAKKMVWIDDDNELRKLLVLSVLMNHRSSHLVQCYGWSFWVNEMWIFMELLASVDIILIKLQGPIPEDIVSKMAVTIVKALDYLNSQHHMIHGGTDSHALRPSKVLVDSDGNIKLCGFGVIDRSPVESPRLSSVHYRYLAPERISIQPNSYDYGIRSDIWSLGISLLELANGQLPYSEHEFSNVFQLLTHIVRAPPPLPDKAKFSPPFFDFVSKCLTKEVIERPGYSDLLQHPLIKEYESKDIDIGQWLRDLNKTHGPFMW